MLRRLCLLLPLLAGSPAAQTLPAVDAVVADSLALIGGGAVVLVVHDGGVLHRAAYGSFSEDEVVATASAAKWLSGGVLASLVSDGTLALDDPLSDFFPALQGPKRGITVAQLFAHTSGLPGNDDPAGRAPCIADRAATLAACAEAILALPLSRPPGSAFAYGANSMHVAGRVAEIATGQRWADLFAERIARPLGMTRTGYRSPTNPWVAAGMWTTAEDYVAFLQMVLDGGTYEGRRVLGADAVAAMLADQTAGAPIASSPLDNYAGYPGFQITERVYGLGVWREREGPDGRVRVASSPGGLGVVPWVDIERGVAGVLLAQDRLTDTMGTYLEIQRLVAEAVDGGATAAERAPRGPAGPVLEPPSPHPAAGAATVRYRLERAGRARLVLRDARGRRVAVLDDRRRGAGAHAVRVGLDGVRPGAYWVVLLAGGERRAQKLVVAR